MASGVEDKSCTVEDLTTLLTEPSDGFMMLPDAAMNKVYPGVFIGDIGSAKNRFTLSKAGITHILNTAEGTSDFQAKPDLELYEKLNITYKGITALDETDYPLHEAFTETAEFIDQALEQKGTILVHCMAGVSRSSTIVLAFLMLKRQMTAPDAVRLVRKHREISPNDSFLQQLCDLNQRLSQESHFDQKTLEKD